MVVEMDDFIGGELIAAVMQRADEIGIHAVVMQLDHLLGIQSGAGAFHVGGEAG